MISHAAEAQPGDGTAAGDAEWFEEICGRTYRFTLAYLIRRTGHRQDAEDLAAETYAVAWRRLDEFRRADRPQAWLYGVAFRCLQNSRRSRERQGRLTDQISSELRTASAHADPAQLVQVTSEVAAMERALASLGIRDQEVLRLLGYEGLTHSEIALVLDISPALVRGIVYRARRRLNKAMTLDAVTFREGDHVR